MEKTIYFIFIVLLNFQLNAQVSPVNFIDTSVETAGITKILSYDINNDGFKDIITSTMGTNGRFGYYLNQTNSTFGAFNLIGNFQFCRGFAYGDFNNDNLLDFAVIGDIANDSKIYINNNNGTFDISLLDSNLTTLNKVVVADFDGNSSDDIVIIGQHSIDFYRNNGSGLFTKESILTTSTSPLVLECIDLAVKDLDGDGDLDLITAETAGLVTYTNNGVGVFTPNYHSLLPEIYSLVHPIDVDNDGDFDIVCRNSANQLKWFSNNGSGVMTYQGVVSTVSNMTAINSVDYNGDGLDDLYVSYPYHISVFVNNSAHTFIDEFILHQTQSLIMGQLAVVDINNQGGLDYVWSGGNNTLAFHLNQSTLSVENQERNTLRLYPNPTNGVLNATEPIEKASIYTLLGTKVADYANVNSIDISSFSSGIYILKIDNKGSTFTRKIEKN